MKRISGKIISWIKREEHLLYQIGYIILQKEDKIEKALLKTAQQFETSTLFDDSFKQNFISTYINVCKLEANKGKNTEVTPTVAEDLFQLDDLERMIIYMKYVLALNDQQISYFLDITADEVSAFVESGLKKLLENKYSREFRDVNKLLNYHHGLLTLAEYKVINTMLQTNNQLKIEYEEILDTIEQLRGYSVAIQPSNYFLMQDKPLTEAQKKRRKRNQVWFAFSLSLLLMIGVGVSMFDPTSFEMWWKRVTSDVAYGEPVFISATDGDIRITITHAAADENQTVLFYEIENMNDREGGNHQYIISNLFSVAQEDIWSIPSAHLNSIPSNPKEGTNKGKLVLPPIKSKEELITLQFNSLTKLDVDDNPLVPTNRISGELVKGDWEITVPVMKLEPYEINIDKKVVVGNDTFHFEKLQVNPTSTKISVRHVNNEVDDETRTEMQYLLSYLEVNERRLLPSYTQAESRNDELIGSFDSIYYTNKEQEVLIHVERLYTYIDYHNPVELNIDLHNLPTVKDHLGTDLMIKRSDNDLQIVITPVEPFENSQFDGFFIKYGYNGNSISKESTYLDIDGNVVEDINNEYYAWLNWTTGYRAIDRLYKIQYVPRDQERLLVYIDGHRSTIHLKEVISVEGF